MRISFKPEKTDNKKGCLSGKTTLIFLLNPQLLNDLDLVAENRDREVLILACSDDSHDCADDSANPTYKGNAFHDANDDAVINVASYIR